jgi:hypothetical protein
MAYANAADVEARLGRSLDAGETTIVNTRLNDVELMIRSRLPNLDTLVSTGVLDVEVVIMVEAEAILRLVKNPDGYTAETDGNYSYQISTKVASGRLDIFPTEWALLGVMNGAFTIRPYIGPYYTSNPPYGWEDVNRPFADFPSWDGSRSPEWWDFNTGTEAMF